jgi:hypothetical protein
MAGFGTNDPVLVALRYAPFLFVIVGIGLVLWLARQRLPNELHSDVLAALSETEALPTATIRQRPPLVYQHIDTETLVAVLDHLCRDGQVVRWYEQLDPPGSGAERQAVYRRVSAAPA